MQDIFDEALHFAIEKHSGQIRKMGSTPYIIHPLEVATIVSTMTDDHEILAAAVLHDTVEDAEVKPEEIVARFGNRVAALVASETEDKLSSRPQTETWMERKLETLLILQHTHDIGVKMIWLGDKLANLRSFYRTLQEMGEDMWNVFNQKDPRIQRWYYETILKNLSELEDTFAYSEFQSLIHKIFDSYGSYDFSLDNEQ